MSVWTLITTIVKFMPELIELIRRLADGVQAGVKEARLKKDLRAISKALRVKDGKQAASDLNDVFRD